MKNTSTLLTQYWFPTALVIVTGFFVVGPEDFRELLRYDRSAVAQGELWRLFTANLIHSNWIHWIFNAIGLVFIWHLFIDSLKVHEWILTLITLFIINIVCLHYFNASLMWYVGMSGALHGLLVTLLLTKSYLTVKQSVIALAVVVGKIIYETWFQTNNPMESLIGVKVATDAHLFGVVSGFVVGPAIFWFKHVSKTASRKQNKKD